MEETLYYDLYQYLTNQTIPDNYNEQQTNRLLQLAKLYYIQNDKLFQINKNNIIQQVIIPSQIETVLFNLHKDMTGAHLGVE